MGIGLKRGTVALEEHQSAWERSAENVIAELRMALDGLGADMEHVGSTAIFSIWAKPIVDLAVAVRDFDAMLARNDALEAHGIVFRQDMRPEQLLYVKGDFAADTRTHHIHVVLRDSREWRNYLIFRDYLNANARAAAAYEAVKRELAERFPDNREAYTAGKAEVISRLLREAEAWSGRYVPLRGT